MTTATAKDVPNGAPALEASKAEGEALLSEVKELWVGCEVPLVELIDKMRVIEKQELFTLHGFRSMNAYVEKELHMKARKYFYLKALGEKTERIGVSKEKVERLTKKIGSTKMRAVVTAAKDEKEVDALAEKAERMTYEELAKTVREHKGVTEKLWPRKFMLYEEQLRNVNNALKAASEKSGSDKEGHNLDMICMEYMNGAMINGDLDKGGLGNLLKSIERTCDVKMVVIRGGRTVWGKKLLEELK
jgi:hypothetical protein